MKEIRRTSQVLALVLAALALPACGDHEDSPPDGPPPAPSALKGVDDLGEDIPAGGRIGEGKLVVSGLVSPLHSSLPVKLWAEFYPVAGGYSKSFCSAESATTSTLSVPVRDLSPGPYRCVAWCQDGQGRTSPRVEMGDSPAVDLIVDPTLPTRLEQVRVDGFTEIAPGAAIPERVALFRARVHSSSGTLVRASFELKPLGTPFDGSEEVSGSQVASGSWSEVQVPLPVGPCHWQVRTESYAGDKGGAVEFGVAPLAPDLIRNPPAPTAGVPAPVWAGQYFTGGFIPINVGGSTEESSVLFSAKLSGTSFMALEVEIKPVALAFDGLETRVGIFVSDGGLSRILEPLPLGAWHWRFRTAAVDGNVSGWLSFGGNLDGIPASTDFTRISGYPFPPGAPTNLRQYRLDGRTSIPYGEEIPETGFVTQARVSDSDEGEALFLEVEVRPSDQGFQNVPTHLASPVASGGTASLTIERLIPDTFYRWQARTRDARGTVSSWTVFSAPPAPSTGGGSSSGSVRSGSNCSGTSGLQGGAATWIGLLGLVLLALAGRRTA